MGDKTPEEEKGVSPAVPIFAVIFALILWGVNLCLLYEMKPEERGTFGDMFGAVNALFSGLAFAGVIYAILLQRKDLNLTQDELRGQKEQMQIQNATLSLQRFESTFFQMLGNHMEIVRTSKINKPTGGVEGRECFSLCYGELDELFTADKFYSDNSDESAQRTLINDKYLEFYRMRKSDIGHYFRSLYHIVKFIDKSTLPMDDRYQYTSLLRAHLSNDEMRLLFYNCLSDQGNERFKPLIERYSLLHNMDMESLIHSSHKNYYDPSAFDPNK